MVAEDEVTIPDYAFLCFNRLKGIGHEGEQNYYRKFFITDEYNMNDTANSSSNYIAGRFVLQSDNDSIIITGISEEPANVLSLPDDTKDIESFFVKIRAEHKPGNYCNRHKNT